MLAGYGELEQGDENEESKPKSRCAPREIVDNTIRIARLKLLFIAAKITNHSNVSEVKYSRYDSRVPGFFKFLEYLDRRIKELSPWLDNKRWQSRHLLSLGIKQFAFS